jgi:hypothetical protein
MNLVAKEFVAARADGGGALVLSAFTGAARELRDALLVNPFDLDGFADALRLGLELPDAERRRRMARLRAAVTEHTIYDWARDLIVELGRAATAGRPAAPIDLEAARLARLVADRRPGDGVAPVLASPTIPAHLRSLGLDGVPATECRPAFGRVRGR